jgi:hypothetical protein
MKRILLDGVIAGTKHGIIFVVFSFFLTRPVAWCRVLGVLASSSWSLYLATFYNFLPWTNYLNVLCNMLYITASRKNVRPLPSIDAYFADKNPRRMHNQSFQPLLSVKTLN